MENNMENMEVMDLVPAEVDEIETEETNDGFGMGVAAGALLTIAAIGIGKLAKKGYEHFKNKKKVKSDSEGPIDVEYSEVTEENDIKESEKKQIKK